MLGNHLLRSRSVRVPILMYHKIGPAAHSPFWVNTDVFRGQMHQLKQWGCQSITLENMLWMIGGVLPWPRRPVMLTFDDGYESFINEVFPILSHPTLRFPAVCFIPTGRIGNTNAWDSGDCDPVVNHLNWDQIQTLHQTGLVDFQSHTVTHPNLEEFSDRPELVGDELSVSRQTLEEQLGKRVRAISWPHGNCNDRIIEVAKRAGYECGFSVLEGVEDRFDNLWMLRRIMVTDHTNLQPIVRPRFDLRDHVPASVKRTAPYRLLRAAKRGLRCETQRRAPTTEEQRL